MKNIRFWALAGAFLCTLSACDEKDEDVVTPLMGIAYPQVVLFSDEGDGGLEDEDKFSFKITLADRVDPAGEDLGGKVVPLEKEVTVHFQITGTEGFTQLSDYIKDWTAFYEIDDCTTSEDQNIDLDLTFDPATGLGSVRFPAGVDEIEVEFETNEGLFEDDTFNSQGRGLVLKLIGLHGNSQNVVANTTSEFEYKVLDDEGVYGEWELDVEDASEFQNFKSLFGLISADIKDLKAEDVEEITIAFGYGEWKAEVKLQETEMIEECGKGKAENKVIELEAEFEELEDDKPEGKVEFAESIEQENGSEVDFTYAGTFQVIGKKLTLTLKGEYDDSETSALTLHLKK
ncbi:hypothetical protein [Rufibacter latericius]|uniref:Uncharacterized protein n=1 Tax=Rufibacter latericius TaxID=2487040 RepID=A0A3M9MY84_9BACT|nr:hypothetical protein [Rufibacter latericius]RNI30501.1 hypothetical protein EFB08_04375 [Rufibacter latericius]